MFFWVKAVRRRAVWAEPLEPRLVLSSFDISGVQAAALDQPQIHALFRTTANGTPLQASDGFGGFSFDVQAFLDTGTSGLLLSQETAQGLGIASSTFGGQTVTYADVGVAGAELFDVSTPVYAALAPFIPTADVDNINTYQTVYNQTYGPVRTEINRTPADDLIGPLDILGMPVLNGKVMVMNPRPVENLENMYTWVYNPGTAFNAGAVNTNPGIPTVNRHVKLSYGNFTRFTQVTPTGATGPNLGANPFIGPDPTRALQTNPPPDNTPSVQLVQGTHSSTGSFLFDTGAGASFISQAEAANLHVHYKAGTYNSANPILVDDNGVAIPNQFQIPLGGIGGELNAAGFFVDSLTLPTVEGQGVRFLKAPVLVADVSVQDPITHQTLTLDGDFGMNFLVASCDISTGFPENITAGAFDWVTFDQPNGLLGLQIPGAPSVYSLTFASGNNAVYVKRDADGTHADFWVNSATPGSGTPTQQATISQNDSYSITGGTGNENVTVDFSNGNPLPANGLSYDGGAGSNALAFVGTSGNDVLTAGSSGITFTGGTFCNVPINPANVQSIQFHGGTGGNDAVNVTGGTWTVDADTPTGTPNVSVTVAAGAATTFAGAQNLAALTVNGSAKLTAATRKTLSINALSISGAGQLDLGVGDLMIGTLNGQTATAAAAQQLVKQAASLASKNAAGYPLFTGTTGITSSAVKTDAAANSPQRLAIGVAGSSDPSMHWAGNPVDGTIPAGKTVVSVTVYGDANLDHLVDVADLSIWNNNFASGNHWAQADFNYDGTIDIADLSTWNNNFATSAAFADAAAPVASSSGSAGIISANSPAAPSSRARLAVPPKGRPLPSVATEVTLAPVRFLPSPKHRRRIDELRLPPALFAANLA
jgi:hypothetical protein